MNERTENGYKPDLARAHLVPSPPSVHFHQRTDKADLVCEHAAKPESSACAQLQIDYHKHLILPNTVLQFESGRRPDRVTCLGRILLAGAKT